MPYISIHWRHTCQKSTLARASIVTVTYSQMTLFPHSWVQSPTSSPHCPKSFHWTLWNKIPKSSPLLSVSLCLLALIKTWLSSEVTAPWQTFEEVVFSSHTPHALRWGRCLSYSLCCFWKLSLPFETSVSLKHMPVGNIPPITHPCCNHLSPSTTFIRGLCWLHQHLAYVDFSINHFIHVV